MGFRISNIHEYDRFVAIDLGTYRVRAALYGIDGGEIILEGYASVRQHRRNIEHGVIADMAGVASTIEKALYEACKESVHIPEDVIISYTPSVSLPESITSQYIRRDSDAPLSMDELDMMIEKIEGLALSKAREKAKKEYAIHHDDIRLISSTLTSVMIDGKIVDDPIGSHGEHVRITVMNVYTIASEYNMIRSIVSSLSRNTISLVPGVLLFPKLLDRSIHKKDSSLLIDLGYTHLTMLSTDRGEFRYFETFSTGSRMLIDMIAEAAPRLSYTEIESLIMRVDPTPADRDLRDQRAHEYLAYLIDMIASVLAREGDSLRQKYVILSGGILDSEWIRELFEELIGEHMSAPLGYTSLIDTIDDAPAPPEYLLVEGLSGLGYELLHIQKDPIIRILRYTLHHYE